MIRANVVFRGLGAVVVATLMSVPALAAKVTVKGRCADTNGNGIAGAKFEVRDQWIKDKKKSGSDHSLEKSNDFVNLGIPGTPQNALLRKGFTDANGRFEVTVDHGDWGINPWADENKPDIYVRCLLETSENWMITASPLPWPRSVESDTRIDSDASPQDHGALKFDAAHVTMFNLMRDVLTTLRNRTGLTFKPAIIAYPFGAQRVAGTKDVTGFAGIVFVAIGQGQEAKWLLSHELGHGMHVQALVDLTRLDTVGTMLERVKQLWAQADTLGGRIADHDYEKKTSQEIAFFDGWASFVSAVVAGFRDESKEVRGVGYASDQSRMPDCAARLRDYEWSNGFDDKKQGGRTAIGGESDRLQVEAIVGCRLWRLYQKWGWNDVWRALKQSRALTWPQFIAEYRKIHRDADDVAVPREPMIMASGCSNYRMVSAGRFRWGENGDVFHSNGSAYCLLGRRLPWVYWKGAAARYRDGYLGLRVEKCVSPVMAFHGWCQSGTVKKPGDPTEPYAIGGLHGRYNWHSSWALTDEGRSAVLFRAEAQNDIHIGFSERTETRSPMYEVVIGGWGNTKSVCRRRSQGDQFAEARVSIPSRTISPPGRGPGVDWWVSVDKATKKISVGRGTAVGTGTMFECTDGNFLSNLRYFSLSSWNSSIRFHDVRTIALP
ncbi:MAG: hypothetical protein HYY84_08790 [Deltaproteobacteria bacterium]|nr:hypothetical protein [Deltaproteobacteria bacterium]